MTEALKYDKDKPPMDLLPYATLLEVAKVLGFGAEKYDRHNWRNGFEYSRLHAAALRHIGAWSEGEDLDPESGLNHIAHALCCLMFLLEHQLKGYGVDDRYTTPSKINISDTTVSITKANPLPYTEEEYNKWVKKNSDECTTIPVEWQYSSNTWANPFGDGRINHPLLGKEFEKDD